MGNPEDAHWPKFKDAFWQALKPHFVRTQHDKCGYCEIIISSDGDVEHYRPKKGIQELTREGVEAEDSKRLSGRGRPQITEQGYWWLAYEWDNYLLSCKICNQKYKNALFPVALPRPVRDHEEFKAHNPKKRDVSIEKPLLINPFEKEFKPFDYFEYTIDGFIKPRNGNVRALETIKVCGLHRVNLKIKRGGKARTIWQNSKKLMHVTVVRPNLVAQEILAVNLFFDGHEINAFAGMVRVIFKQTTGLEWSELEHLLQKKGWMSQVEERVQSALSIRGN